MARLLVTGLAVCMLLSGSLNTIATKLQDNVVVGTDEKGHPVTFKHPAVQTAFMFAGEMLCLIPFFIRRWWKQHTGRLDELSEEEKELRAKRFSRSVWVFMIPALCDAGATTMLNLGLYYTYASVFQMLRGTLVIFAGLLTIVLLKRSLYIHHWMGMVLITAGAALVGASSVIYSGGGRGGPEEGGEGNVRWWGLLQGDSAPSSAPNPLLGNVLVVLAQLLAATQFIVEEKFLAKYHAPVLLAVGMEGFWGVMLSCAVLPLLGHVKGPDGLPLDSLEEAVEQIRGNWTLQWTTWTTVLSIAVFNFMGVSVTKKLSGASRATIDACRTLIIWLFSLHVGWEKFHMLQVVGFVVLVSGTSVYNEILRAFLPAPPPHRRRRHHRRTQAGPAAAEATASAALEEGASLRQPLLAGEESGGEPAGARRTGEGAQRQAGVRFAPGTGQEAGTSRPPLPARPRPIDSHRERYTMARSVTILPAALSPHSLASFPPGTSYYTDGTPGSFAASSFAASSYMSSAGGDLLGASPPRSGVVELEGSEYASESDVGEMSGHGGSRARERLERSGGGQPGPGGPEGEAGGSGADGARDA